MAARGCVREPRRIELDNKTGVSGDSIFKFLRGLEHENLSIGKSCTKKDNRGENKNNL
jgi:hypothetical protein